MYFLVFIVLLNSCCASDTSSFVDVGYCNLALKQCLNDNTISIHGFWPEYPNNDWFNDFPQWCNKSACQDFAIEDLQTVRDDLEKYWYSCPEWHSRNEDLWRHEWCRHGTCLVSSSPLEYFTLALSAFKQAKNNHWFSCCKFVDNRVFHIQNQCMVPFDVYGNWLQYCH